jgi:hypothetical protein
VPGRGPAGRAAGRPGRSRAAAELAPRSPAGRTRRPPRTRVAMLAAGRRELHPGRVPMTAPRGQTLLVRPGRSPGRRLGPGPRGPREPAQAALAGRRAVLVDDHPQPNPDGLPVLATAEGGLAALEQCDVVVKTPGLSRYRPEVARLSGLGIPVVGGLGLWLAEADLRRVLCVTGTKGKSTTSSVTGHLLTGWATGAWSAATSARRPTTPPRRGGRLRLLGHRGVQLPGHRPAVHAAGGRGHLAAPGPPRLARRGGAVLPGQAVRLLAARGRTDRGQRRQRPARERVACSARGWSGCRRTTIPARTGWSRSGCPGGTTAATR